MLDHNHENEVIVFAETNFRNQRVRFGIKTPDRRNHVYTIGKTGMGKTTLQENMVMEDILAGHGVGVIDPHGDFAERILDFIPPHRINDIVYFNPADIEYPIGFNILETVNPEHKHLVASGMMGVFKKIWPDVWSPRMEYILNNCILALLDYPGSTMLGVNRLLVDKEFRRRVITQIKDPVVRVFWVDEYARYHDRFQVEAIAPIQNKVGQFLSASIIRNVVAQVKSTINMREIIDAGKIFIVNLSKGRIGEESSNLLGGLLITRLQLAAMERIDIPEKERKDFYLYVDEFQNFATPTFADIMSEARKFRLCLTVAHQYIEQLDEKVRAAVFGNVGTLICFRVGAGDAEFLEKEFTPYFTAEDLVNLTKFDIYLKLMIDGVASNPFSAITLPPFAKSTGSREKVIKISRERYAVKKSVIEEKIERWVGVTQMAPEMKIGLPAIGRAATRTEGRFGQRKMERKIERGEPLSAVGATKSAFGQTKSAFGQTKSAFGSTKSAVEARPVEKEETPFSRSKKFIISCAGCGKKLQTNVRPDPARKYYCTKCKELKFSKALSKEAPAIRAKKYGPPAPSPVRSKTPEASADARAHRTSNGASGKRTSELVTRESKEKPLLLSDLKAKIEEQMGKKQSPAGSSANLSIGGLPKEGNSVSAEEKKRRSIKPGEKVKL